MNHDLLLHFFRRSVLLAEFAQRDDVRGRWLPEHHMRLDPARSILRGRPLMDAGGAGRHFPLPFGEQRPPAGDRVQCAPLSKTSPMVGQRPTG